MRSVAITGIAGYLGTQLTLALDKTDEVERIMGFDVREPLAQSPKLAFHRQDIGAPLAPAFREATVDTAIHLAFLLSPHRSWDYARSVNVEGTKNFLNACDAAGVSRIIYLSSTSAYGARADNPVPLTEESPLRPNEGFQYAVHKAETDRLFQSYAADHPKTKVAILRTCVVMGPTADNSVTRSLFKPAMLTVAGCNPPMQFIHEDDLARITLTCLDMGLEGIYNVAADGTLTYADIATLVKRRRVSVPAGLLMPVMDFAWALRLQSESPSAGLDFIRYPWVADNERIKQATGFQFAHTSTDALQAFVDAKLGPRNR